MKKHIPNTITCCNLISGCIATYFAFMGIYYLALLFIVIGAVFDFFDGMVARLLHVSSPIGKELDSLADDITFGFAPSAIIFSYLSSFHIHAPFVPFLAFVMAAFSALRLAKFNLDERQALGFIALKFKHWGWKDNEVKYVFLLSCIPLLLFLGIIGFAAIIAWYVILSVVTMKK